MGLSHYRFRSVWDLDTPPGDVYAVLERAAEYPEWWPQVREVVWREDGGGGGGERAAGSARIRSLLPYDLRITARLTLRDPAARVLAIELDGDLEGWARWRLAPRATSHGAPHGSAPRAVSGTRAVFEQEVEARRPLLRLLALPGRPLFAANHALMMRAGHRGLRRRLGEGPPGGRGKEFG
ncbi:SRPBCC family protein [Streptomyces nanhaiensis]|uniref:SRPBCC family protein n=1 Tax=Streptomyces nanhaiensis TaxID=679319 RepID=UPI00399D4FC5